MDNLLAPMAAEGHEGKVGCDDETRILLVGKAGVGKSTTGNTILGKKLLGASIGSRTVHKTSAYEENQHFGRKLVVVDTPGFIHTDKNCEETARELSKIFGYLHRGFHAMIYVIGAEKFSTECIETKDLFLKVFGEAVAKYTIIIITHLDLLLEESFDPDDYLSLTSKEFRKFQKQCNQRVIFLDNKADADEMENQAKQIVDMVDAISRANDSPCFTNQLLRLTNSYLRLEQMTGKTQRNRAKRELFRRGARALGIRRDLFWDKAKDIPVNKELGLYTSDANIERTASTLGMAKLGQKALPDAKPKIIRRYSVCADGATEAYTDTTIAANGATATNDNGNIDKIEETPDNDFDPNVLNILVDVEKLDVNYDSSESGIANDDSKEFRHTIDEKNFFEQFVGFFSYFFVPMVSIKKSNKK